MQTNLDDLCGIITFNVQNAKCNCLILECEAEEWSLLFQTTLHHIRNHAIFMKESQISDE
jgi:hypothetical protein